MKAKFRWGLAVLLLIFIVFAHYYPTTKVTSWIIKVVYSTHDFSAIRELLYDDTPIALPVFDDGQPTMKNYKSITAMNDKFKLTYNRPITIFAKANGVVIFSAHTATTGKAVIVAYDNGVTAHFENVTTIHKLPYTTVVKGEQLATVENGELFLALFKDGQSLSEEQVIRWITDGL